MNSLPRKHFFLDCGIINNVCKRRKNKSVYDNFHDAFAKLAQGYEAHMISSPFLNFEVAGLTIKEIIDFDRMQNDFKRMALKPKYRSKYSLLLADFLDFIEGEYINKNNLISSRSLSERLNFEVSYKKGWGAFAIHKVILKSIQDSDALRRNIAIELLQTLRPESFTESEEQVNQFEIQFLRLFIELQQKSNWDVPFFRLCSNIFRHKLREEPWQLSRTSEIVDSEIVHFAYFGRKAKPPRLNLPVTILTTERVRNWEKRIKVFSQLIDYINEEMIPVHNSVYPGDILSPLRKASDSIHVFCPETGLLKDSLKV